MSMRQTTLLTLLLQTAVMSAGDDDDPAPDLYRCTRLATLRTAQAERDPECSEPDSGTTR